MRYREYFSKNILNLQYCIAFVHNIKYNVFKERRNIMSDFQKFLEQNLSNITIDNTEDAYIPEYDIIQEVTSVIKLIL